MMSKWKPRPDRDRAADPQAIRFYLSNAEALATMSARFVSQVTTRQMLRASRYRSDQQEQPTP